MVEDDPFGGVLYNFRALQSNVAGAGCLPLALIIGLIVLPFLLVYLLLKLLVRTYSSLVKSNPFGFSDSVAPLYYLLIMSAAVAAVYIVAALAN